MLYRQLKWHLVHCVLPHGLATGALWRDMANAKGGDGSLVSA